MADRSSVHVEPRESGWAVVREGSERATSLHQTQAEAAKVGRSIARREETEFFLHAQDGRVREHRSYGEGARTAEELAADHPITEPVPVQIVNDFRAQNAFQTCLEQDLDPGLEVPFNFDIPDGKRLVIELVTARVLVPAGERARLRLVTYLGTDDYVFDLSLTSQGQIGGQAEVLVATHAIRTYADKRPSATEDFQVNVYRDNDVTPGHALICLSGYLVDLAP